MRESGPWWRRLLVGRRPPIEAAPAPTPLSIRRLGDVLSRHDFSFRVDEDGDLTGLWDEHPFWFMLRGDSAEVVHIRGLWSASIPEAARVSVRQTVNDWNREQVLPKAYLRTEGSSLALYADHAVIMQGGATDEQLARTVLGTLAATLRLFGALSGQQPH